MGVDLELPQELSFEASPPLRLPAGFNLTVECSTRRQMLSLFSPEGGVEVPRSSHLLFKRCQVMTLPSLEEAGLDSSHEQVVDGFFGRSPGHVHFHDCDLLVSLQFMQAYVGYHEPVAGRPLPEYIASSYPRALFESSALFTDAAYKAAALSFRRAHFQLSSIAIATVTCYFADASIWYSIESRAAAMPLLAAAEAARAAGELDWAYGAAVNPRGPFPESSVTGELPLPELRSGNESGPAVSTGHIARTSGFVFNEAEGLPQPLGDAEATGFGITMLQSGGRPVALVLPPADARGREGGKAGKGGSGKLNKSVKLWHVLAGVLGVVLLVSLVGGTWCCMCARARARTQRRRSHLPTVYGSTLKPLKAASGSRYGAGPLRAGMPSAGGATGSGQGGGFGGVNELDMTEDAVRSGVEAIDAAAGGPDFGKFPTLMTSSSRTLGEGGQGVLGAVDAIVPDLWPSRQPGGAAGTVDTGCGSGVVNLGLSSGWSGGMSAGPSGGLIGGGWAHMGGVSRCFVPNSVALAALQKEQWKEELALEAAPEEEARHVQGKVAVAVKEMQGALQAELQDDHLQLLGVLGRGGFGVVYHGQWRGLEVAIKTVIFSSSRDDEETAVVASEAAIASNLGHRNVVATYSHDILDVAKAVGHELAVFKFYLIQEYCNGGSLRAVVEEGLFGGPTMRARWRRISVALCGLAAGMHYLHSKRICHGDLNPSNVLMKVSPPG
eukprot:jgi/Ulvmu1/11822/UM080_0033.1